jgi:hypothetical protein
MSKKQKKTDKHDQINMCDAFGWKLAHGGKRVGSGSPKGALDTEVLRVPVELVSHVKQLIDDYKKEVSND